jgi:hypothetical protein
MTSILKLNFFENLQNHHDFYDMDSCFVAVYHEMPTLDKVNFRARCCNESQMICYRKEQIVTF